MKNKIPQIIYFLINVLIVFCVFYYPVTRDEFYYFDRLSSWQLFREYYNSYLYINPRIGQFVTNIVSRNIFIEIIYAVILFNGFFYMLYLLIFRKKPDYRDSGSVKKIIIIIAVFIFFSKFFGEMFLYTPFSGNYTFIMLFYLLYIYILLEYFVYGNFIFKDRKSPLFLFLIALLGVFTGMGNEHIPPVLIAFTLLGILYSVTKHKKLPPKIIMTYFLSLISGYILLYFAPANSERYQRLANTEQTFHIVEYINQFKEVLLLYRYYLAELLFVVVLIIILMIFFYKKIQIEIENKIRILLFFVIGLSTLPIVAYAPIRGLRLLFFTNTLWLICISFIVFSLLKNIRYKKTELQMYSLSSFCLVMFFSAGCYICYKANKNSESVFEEISTKSLKSDKVVLDKQFDYFSPELDFFNMNRRFLLDSGVGYIDADAAKDTNQEMNIKSKFHLKELSVKNEK